MCFSMVYRHFFAIDANVLDVFLKNSVLKWFWKVLTKNTQNA